MFRIGQMIMAQRRYVGVITYVNQTEEGTYYTIKCKDSNGSVVNKTVKPWYLIEVL